MSFYIVDDASKKVELLITEDNMEIFLKKTLMSEKKYIKKHFNI